MAFEYGVWTWYLNVVFERSITGNFFIDNYSTIRIRALILFSRLKLSATRGLLALIAFALARILFSLAFEGLLANSLLSLVAPKSRLKLLVIVGKIIYYY